MELGFMMFPTVESIDPGSLAQLVEERGHTALYLPEHTHIPVGTVSAPGKGKVLPREYERGYDLFVALTMAVMATRRLRIGSGVCLLPQRDPIVTANAIATLDQISGGRFEFGIGAGWNVAEMANHGVDPARRWASMRERVEAMKELWTRDVADYEGAHVSFQRVISLPKPLQLPHPPVLVGGSGPRVLERVRAYGDGWIPSHNAGNILERVREVTQGDPALPVFVLSVPPDPQAIASYAEAGVRRIFTVLPTARRDAVERAIERFETAVDIAYGGAHDKEAA
jgi:probable F420-dependent oxidoreductase